MAKDKMTLGEDAIFSTDSNKTGLNNNVIVCGSSGSGKSMSILQPRLLDTYNSSLIVTVTKRRLVDKYKPLFQQRGYIVEDLNFANPTESTITYDPLYYVHSHQDIKFLAESIVMADPRKQTATVDPYWDTAAVSLLSAEIAFVLTKNKKATFNDVLNFHDRLDIKDTPGGLIKTSFDGTFEALAKDDPHCYAVTCWKSFRRLPATTAGCVYGVLNTTIDTLFGPELRKAMAEKPSIDFEKLSNKKTVLFLSTSPVNPSLNSFVNILYSQAFLSLFEYAESFPNGRLPIPVHVLCDDFATGSRILNFPEYISIIREKDMSVTILIQSETQLESIYGIADATTIINNCDTYVYMGGMDLKTGRSISERTNLPLAEILSMPIGQEYVFRRGLEPIFTTRYEVTKDRRYLNVSEPVCFCPECNTGTVMSLGKGLYECSSCKKSFTKTELRTSLCCKQLQSLCEIQLERQLEKQETIKQEFRKVIQEIRGVNRQILDYREQSISLEKQLENAKGDSVSVDEELRLIKEKLFAAEARLEELQEVYRTYENQVKWINYYNNATSDNRTIN